MNELTKQSIKAVKSLLANEYNDYELDNLIIDSLDLLLYRFVRSGITTDRHSKMVGTDISEYVSVLKESKEVLDSLETTVKIIQGNVFQLEADYEIYTPFKNLFQYLFTNYNLNSEEFKKGLESLMQDSFDELINTLEIMIFNYLRTFYYVVEKRYYYKGETTQVILEGLETNKNVKKLFEEIANPEKLLEKITQIIKKNRYDNLSYIVLELFKEFYRTAHSQLKNIFPIKEIEFNETDVEILLGEGYLTRTLDENTKILNQEIKSLVKNKEQVFLNSLKNQKIISFSENMQRFTNNLEIFMTYFCDNLEVFTKTTLFAFEDVFKQITSKDLIIPEYIDIEKKVKQAERSGTSINIKNINKEVLSKIINNLRQHSGIKAVDNILMGSFNIIYSIIPYITLVDILAELKFSKGMIKQYFNHVVSLQPLIELALEKILEGQEEYAKSTKFKFQYMSQFESEVEELESLEDSEEIRTGKKGEFSPPEKISDFDAQNLDQVIERHIGSLIDKLTFIAIMVQYPRKTKTVQYSKELFEEWYEPILTQKRFKNITKSKVKSLLEGTNLIVNYSKIIGSSSILAMTGKRDFLYWSNFGEYMEKRAESENIKNVISEDLIKGMQEYLGSSGRMLRDFFEIGKVHSKGLIHNLGKIKKVKRGSRGWVSEIKRHSENLNKSLKIMVRDINDMAGQGILNTIMTNTKKEFERMEKNYIVIVNDIFFSILIDKL